MQLRIETVGRYLYA